MKIKPILFNTEMARAILEGRKTVTRRVIKPVAMGLTYEDGSPARKPPYRPGNILYVRETWTRDGDVYRYKAGFYDQNRKWRPSIHMPREAARLFLRVTDVRVERLQDMTEADAVAEGFEAIKCDHPGGYPCTDCMNTGYLEPAMLGFVETWNSTIKPTDCALYGWDTNPWFWVIEFEKIRKEEALRDA